MSGRTTWWAHDAAWHRRERQVELGETFGAAGPNVLAVLHSWAQEQRAAGQVKGGFRALSRDAFTVDVDQARAIVELAAEIGALDELDVADDGKIFTARVSGWAAEQTRAQAAHKKAQQRAGDKPGQKGTGARGRGTVSGPGTSSPVGAPSGASAGRPAAVDVAAANPSPVFDAAGALAENPPSALGNQGASNPSGQVGTNGDVSPSVGNSPPTRPDQTIPSGGGNAREAVEHDWAAIQEGLRAAGYDELAIENDINAIRALLIETHAPANVDWFRVGLLIREKAQEGKIRSERPVDGIKFIAKGFAGLPRIGEPGLFDSTTSRQAERRDSQREHIRRTRDLIQRNGGTS